MLCIGLDIGCFQYLILCFFSFKLYIHVKIASLPFASVVDVETLNLFHMTLNLP